MRKIKYLFALVAIAQTLLITSCDSDFAETNTNTNDPSSVDANLLLAGTLRNTANNVQSIFLAGEAGSCWVQHLGKPVYNTNEMYVPRQNSIEALWNGMYSTVLKEADLMQDLAVTEGNVALEGVALVVKAYGYNVLTDVFGSIPMSEALKADEGIITPKYDDSRMEVYPAILAMLDEAIMKLDGAGTIDASQDLVYGGDASKWKKFASSLKFRMLMRGSSVEAVGTQLDDLVLAGNLFTSNDDSAKVAYLSASPNANPYFEGLIDGGRETEWCMGEELVNYMSSMADGRLAVYAQEVGGDGSGNGYVGKPAGIDDIANSFYGDSNNVSLIGSKFTEAEQPAYFMNYAQLNFLMAEATERGLLTVGDTAANYYAAGITASFDESGADVTGFDTSYAGGASGLDQIANQSWVALFLQGYEAWAEYRRTGSPMLPLAIDAQESSIPSRLNYPLSQQSLNNLNYTDAVANQGANLLTPPLWWTN